MGYSYENVYGHEYKTGKPHWLDESRLLPISSHFIQIAFYVDKAQKSTIQDGPLKQFYTEDSAGRALLLLPRNYITTAEFDGVQIGARKGSVSIIDPEGVWAKGMNFIGAYKNSSARLGQNNMIIYFGWLGLKADSSEESNFIQEIPAVLLKTGFGLDENGVVTINCEFVENSERLLKNVKFNTLEDLTLLNTETNSDIKDKNISEILDYICNSDSPNVENIVAQLEQFNIKLEFDDTYEDSAEAFGEDGMDIKIRLGDNLADKINELISKAMPENPDDEDYTYSYELIRKDIHDIDDAEKGVQGVTLRYGWRKSPTPKKLENMTADQAKSAMASGGEEPVEGPTLLWKKQSTSIDNKILISFDIDLKMLDYATSMMRSDLDKKLAQFGEDDWSDIAEAVDNIKGSDDPSQIAMLSMKPNELAQAVRDMNKNIASSEPAVGLDYEGKSGKFLFVHWRTDDDERIKGAIREFNEVLRDSNNNVEKQIQTIIRNNVFKAKARIMGDPAFGTEYTMFKVYMNTDFTAVGEFASFFNRQWLLTKVSHKIEEGGYFTDLELMALPMETSE